MRLAVRKAHYWKVAGASSAPSNIMVFDCETVFGPSAEVPGGELQKLRLGVAIAYRLEHGTRTRIHRIVFRTADEFWQFVISRLDKKRPLWVFAHNIAYDLGCVSGYGWIMRSGYTTSKAAVSGQLFFLKGHFDGKPLNFCDTINYFRCSLASLGNSVGRAKLEMPTPEAPDETWIEYCGNDVEVAALGIDKLIQFGREHALGPWQPSIAGLAFSAYRSSFMSHKVLVHPYKQALITERTAYYGGVVDTPLVKRKIPGPIYELDVCSMYPHCCTYDLPTKFVRDGRRYGLQAVKRLAEKYLVFADVDLDSPDTQYPVKQRKGTYYPVGTFRTCLAHPELMYAVEHGHVKYLHYISVYEKAPIFKYYMEWFVSRKIEYELAGDDAFRTVCKYYANNLYGKTGQMTPHWQEWGRDSLTQLEEIHGLSEGSLEQWYDKPPDLFLPEETFRFPTIPIPIEVRDIYGVVELKLRQSESRESCPAIAATVTSYARLLLRSYQRIASPGHWFYSDTDSIWVDETGKTNLETAGAIRQDTLGYLSVKSEHSWLVVHGPKDYETSNTVKLKGVSRNAKLTDDGGFRQLQFPSAITQIRDGVDNGVYVRHVTKHLSRCVTKAKVLTTGETVPLNFPDDNPERLKG